MPKAKAISSLSGMLASDMEDYSDVEMLPSPDSNQENTKPAQKKANPTKVTKARKVKPVSQRFSADKPKAAARKTAATKRRPLKQQTNEERGAEADENGHVAETVHEAAAQEVAYDESDDMDIGEKKPAKKGKAPTKPKKTVVEDVESVVQKDGEFEYTPTAARQGKGIKANNHTSSQVIPESQSFNYAPAQEDAVDEMATETITKQSSHARASSKQPQPQVMRRRAGSASDSERDTAIRRKLGDMTNKFNNLDLKYRNLREVGVKEAETNFDKLKKQSEERTKAANDLIASLRKELATQKSVNAELRASRSGLTNAQTSLQAAEVKMAELNAALLASQNDNKALQTKLAASRSASSTVESMSTSAYGRTPGSAVKGRGAAPKTIMVGSVEAAKAAQVAQLKEELYSDFTGLIIRAVDRYDEEDVYDCIQTGRNGSLHFKLSVAIDRDSATSYDDMEVVYTPRLDSNRDKDLIELLPDYLSEEITFSRAHAAKFYSRVVDTMTRRME